MSHIEKRTGDYTDEELESMTDPALASLMHNADPHEGGPQHNLPVRCYRILDRRDRTGTRKH